MAPKKKRERKADKEGGADKKPESNKKRKESGKKAKVVKDKTPEDLEDELSKFIDEETNRVMKEFEEQKESVTSETGDYEQMIREVMWDDINETEERLSSRLERIAGQNRDLDIYDDEMTQEEKLKALDDKKEAVTEAMEKALEDACSRLSEAEQNAGEDNAAADPDNGGITHLSLGFGYGRYGRGGFGGF